MKENSIEEDITRVKQRIEDVKEYIEYGLPYSEYLDLENSFDNILLAYKRVLKENEELKDFKKQVTDIESTNFIKYKNYIPIQKVKDKIEYLDKQQKQWLEDRELKASDSEIIFARDFLQELLERRK